MPARGEGVTWVEKWKIISHSHSLLARGSPRHGGSSSSLISAEPFANRRRLVHRQRSGGGGGGGSSTRLLVPAGASVFFHAYQASRLSRRHRFLSFSAGHSLGCILKCQMYISID